jgi:hypothetical protein
MIIAMISMWVMQVTINQVVHVVTMRDGFMPTSWAMHVARFMSTAVVLRRTFIRIMWRHMDHVLFNHPVVPHVVQMAVMQIVGVVTVCNRSVTATFAVNVSMILMGVIVTGVFVNHYDLPE